MSGLNTYENKQSWKIILAAFASVIVLSSFWYLNSLTSKISEEETQRVKLWAEATRKKAIYVKWSNDLFVKIRREERKKVEVWAEATKRIITTESDNDRNFYLEVISSNTTIPVILTDNKKNIGNWKNIEGVNDGNNILTLKSAEKEKLLKAFAEMQKQNPIIIPYDKLDLSKHTKLFFSNSNIYNELKSHVEQLVSTFINDVVKNSVSVPVIVTDIKNTKVQFFGNLENHKILSKDELIAKAKEMDKRTEPLTIDLGNGNINIIHYENSPIITQLKWFPYIQLGIITLYLMVAYFLFSTYRKAEQNQVWLGMAKETAHQLGTPLSSLYGWTELLKEKGMNYEAEEIEKDVLRLELVTERFSKIGSSPELKDFNLKIAIKHVIDYMSIRLPRKIKIEFMSDENIAAKINKPLFEWVIENLIKNAADAITTAEGIISIKLFSEGNIAVIEVEDNGKGIDKTFAKSIFKPGFTTKKRGWGLGLSLAKRIIEYYHKGKFFLKYSEPGKTIFRIEMR